MDTLVELVTLIINLFSKSRDSKSMGGPLSQGFNFAGVDFPRELARKELSIYSERGHIGFQIYLREKGFDEDFTHEYSSFISNSYRNLSSFDRFRLDRSMDLN